MIEPDTIEKAKVLLDLLSCARNLRSCLVTGPSAKLQLFALEKNETLYGETTIGPKLEPDLRLAIVDFVIEHIQRRIGDLGVSLP